MLEHWLHLLLGAGIPAHPEQQQPLGHRLLRQPQRKVSLGVVPTGHEPARSRSGLFVVSHDRRKRHQSHVRGTSTFAGYA